MAGKKAPTWLTVEETAVYLGTTEEALLLSRARGLEPGRLGRKKDGILKWRRAELPKPAPAADPE